MNAKWLLLAADLLDMASDSFMVGRYANDTGLPKDWSQEERLELALAMEVDNVDGRELTPEEIEDVKARVNSYIMNWSAMSFMADRLRDMAKSK